MLFYLIDGSAKFFILILVLCKCLYVHSKKKEHVYSEPTDSIVGSNLNVDSYSLNENPSDYEVMREQLGTTESMPFYIELIGTEHQVCNGVRWPVNGSANLLMDYFNNYIKLLERLTYKVLHNDSEGIRLYKEVQKTKGPRFLRAKFNMSILNAKYAWNETTQLKFIELFNSTKSGWANLTKYMSRIV